MLYINKHIKTKLNILFVFFLISSSIYSQTIESILIKVQNKFEQRKEYKMGVQYSLYRGRSSNIKLSEYPGNLIFNNDILYTKVDETETIINGDQLLKVSHAEKIIVYNSNLSTIKSKELNLKFLLKVLDEKSLTQDTNNWICEMAPKKNSALPYSKIFLIIDKNSFVLKKQIMLLKRKANFSRTKEVDMDFVRLEILFSPIKSLTKEDYSLTNISKYITVKGKEISLIDKYKNYKLILSN